MATRKEHCLELKRIVASIDEELVNDSDSDADCVPEIASSEESDDENDISDLGPGPSVDWFCEKDHQPSIPLFTGNPAVQFVQNGTDMMEYVDNYFTPELIQIVVNQTNLYAQQQIVTMPQPVTKHAHSEQWKPVRTYEMKKCLGMMFLTGVIRKPKLVWYWSTRGILLTPIFSQTMSRNRFKISQGHDKRGKKTIEEG
jgi:hypothetical protein